jgi:uncharacterized protein (DUF2062 family)
MTAFAESSELVRTAASGELDWSLATPFEFISLSKHTLAGWTVGGVLLGAVLAMPAYVFGTWLTRRLPRRRSNAGSSVT